MAYGRITLNKAEIDYLSTMDLRSARQLEASLTAATSPEEKRFYENLLPSVAARSARIAALREGRHGFSESDLLALRGILVAEKPWELPARIVEAKRRGCAGLAGLEAEYALRHGLSEKLERPFLLDTSQDAAPEDEEEEDAADVPAAAYR